MILERTPKISCLTVTTGRVDHVKRSVCCYMEQTYCNKELIVLSQGDDAANQQIFDFIKGLKRQDILFETAPQHLTLGAMRNASCELARGQLVCQWDDDDLYHPWRLTVQYKAIRACKSNVGSAFTCFLKYFKDTGEIYWCDWWNEGCPACKLLPGSVMFYRRYFCEYQSLLYPVHGDQCHVEEDLNVLEKLLDKGAVVPVFCGHMYVYVFHGENTYNLPHHKLAIDTSSGKNVYSIDKLIENRQLLEETFKAIDLGVVNVLSLDGLAFTHEP